jgi:N-acetylmuramoyl-L-alanine amidase
VLAATAAPPARAAGACGEPPRVHIDVGHTPRSPGATSARGTTEYRFNARLAAELSRALAGRGLPRVKVLDYGGRNIRLAARAARLAKLRSGILVSIHHDSVQPRYLKTWTHDGRARRYSDRFRGYSLFVSGRGRAADASRRLALAIGGHLRVSGFAPSLHHAEDIPGEGRPLIDPGAGLYRFDGLAILRRAAIPAVLVEAGIIVNRAEERDLDNTAYRARFVAAVTEGILSFCGSEGR